MICWALVAGAPFLLAVMLVMGGPVDWTASRPAWAGFLYIAVFSQLLGFFAWNRGLALGGVAKVGQLQLLQTFVTLLASAALLGERVTWLQIGFAVLVVAIVAAGRRTQVRQVPGGSARRAE